MDRLYVGADVRFKYVVGFFILSFFNKQNMMKAAKVEWGTWELVYLGKEPRRVV